MNATRTAFTLSLDHERRGGDGSGTLIDPDAYAVEILGDSMLPVYRSGDIVMVSPAAAVRNGDRVIVKTTDGQVMARLLKRRTAKSVELTTFDGRERTVRKAGDIDWIARIIWATQ